MQTQEIPLTHRDTPNTYGGLLYFEAERSKRTLALENVIKNHWTYAAFKEALTNKPDTPDWILGCFILPVLSELRAEFKKQMEG